LPPPEPMAGHTFLADRSGATQTMVTMILPGIPRNHPDYLALYMADQVLGGGYNRLYRNIRLSLGIAYGANSGLQVLPGYGLWIAHSPVQADKTREAMDAFRKELRDLAGERPITQEELDTAKRNLIRGYPSQFEDVASVADYISSIWAFGLPMSEIESWPRRIAAVTLEEVNAAARKYARPDKAVFLLLGDREKIGLTDGLVIVK